MFFGGVLNARYTTIQMLRSNISVLMEGVPEGIELATVESDLLAAAGVTGLHELHVWSLTSGEHCLSVHLTSTDPAQSLASAHAVCKGHGIPRSTVQIVPHGQPCTSGTCVK
jgi:cobalt-zinc-cadmium efflux system protein